MGIYHRSRRAVRYRRSIGWSPDKSVVSDNRRYGPITVHGHDTSDDIGAYHGLETAEAVVAGVSAEMRGSTCYWRCHGRV